MCELGLMTLVAGVHYGDRGDHALHKMSEASSWSCYRLPRLSKTVASLICTSRSHSLDRSVYVPRDHAFSEPAAVDLHIGLQPRNSKVEVKARSDLNTAPTKQQLDIAYHVAIFNASTFLNLQYPALILSNLPPNSSYNLAASREPFCVPCSARQSATHSTASATGRGEFAVKLDELARSSIAASELDCGILKCV